MSYVPPHQRLSSSTTTTATKASKPSATPDCTKLFFDNGRLRGSVSAVADADAVFPLWSPSGRVLAMSPEQIEEIRFRLNIDVTSALESEPAPAPIESFADMGLHTSILKNVKCHESREPTAFQAQAMPVALSGRDLLGCAENGSAKTAAFAIPMIQHCLAQSPICHGDGPLGLVLAPTRTLAQQIEMRFRCFCESVKSIKTAIVVGGTNIAEQRSELRDGVDIVVATPGRFIDHLQQGNTSLSRVSFVVLDEADRMVDMGFEPQIREIMQNMPQKHQTLLFSATMPVEVEALAQEYLSNPVQVKVRKVSSPTANVCQVLEKVPESAKVDRLLALLLDEAIQAESSSCPFPSTIVFVERKTRCDNVAATLVAQGLHAVALHGGRTQKERETAFLDFRNGTTHILVATDVASHGLDVTGVAHVINLDLPKSMEDYVHRIGRTGRAGCLGQATSFYTDRDLFLVAHINKAIEDLQSENVVEFALGKVAERKEEDAMNDLTKLSMLGLDPKSIEDKYRFMIESTNSRRVGMADSAWDD